MSLSRLQSALLATLLLAGCGTLPAPHAAPRVASMAVKAKPDVHTQNFTQVDDRLYRGGQPTEADMKALVKGGVKTDISLQNPFVGKEKQAVAAEKAMAAEVGLKFINLVVPFDAPPTEEMVKTFFETVTDPKLAPVYIHCFHGRDRTGAMVGSYRVQFSGLSNEEAFAEMKTFGFDPKKYPAYAKFVQTFKKRPGFADAAPKIGAF